MNRSLLLCIPPVPCSRPPHGTSPSDLLRSRQPSRNALSSLTTFPHSGSCGETRRSTSSATIPIVSRMQLRRFLKVQRCAAFMPSRHTSVRVRVSAQPAWLMDTKISTKPWFAEVVSMTTPLRLRFFAHSWRSDWNHGNAHFLRGLADELKNLGHEVRCYEASDAWSFVNLLQEASAAKSLQEFRAAFPNLDLRSYQPDNF